MIKIKQDMRKISYIFLSSLTLLSDVRASKSSSEDLGDHQTVRKSSGLTSSSRGIQLNNLDLEKNDLINIVYKPLNSNCVLKSFVNNINNQVNVLHEIARNLWKNIKYYSRKISSSEYTTSAIKYGITDTVEVLGGFSEAFFDYMDAHSK